MGCSSWERLRLNPLGWGENEVSPHLHKVALGTKVCLQSVVTSLCYSAVLSGV